MNKTELARFMAGVRQVESGGNYAALNSLGAGGAYQFMPATWRGAGGSGPAAVWRDSSGHLHVASKAEQDRVARHLMTEYYEKYRNWDLVAAAWHGGPKAADLARRKGLSALKGLSDGYVTTYQYVMRVRKAAGVRRGTHGSGGAHHAPSHGRHEIRPWRLPQRHGGGTARIGGSPSKLQDLANRLTSYMSTVEVAYHRCRYARDQLNLKTLNVGNNRVEKLLVQKLELALDSWDGLRRIPYLMSRDIGYVVEARARLLAADMPKDKRTKRLDALRKNGIAALVTSLDGTKPHHRKHVTELLRQIYKRDGHTPHIHRHLPTTPHRHGGGGGGGGDRKGDRLALSNVELGRAWKGTKSIFDQFVTRFMRKEGLVPNQDYIKWNNPNLGSDHRPERTDSYAIDYIVPGHYGAFNGEDEARKLARAMGIDGWRPNEYQHFIVKVDGERFRVQILWGPGIDHADHIHVGIRRLS